MSVKENTVNPFGPNSGIMGSITGGPIFGTGPIWSTASEVNLLHNKEFQDLKARISQIEERLAILIPNIELQEKFSALQEAYDHYKVLEKLLNDKS